MQPRNLLMPTKKLTKNEKKQEANIAQANFGAPKFGYLAVPCVSRQIFYKIC